MAISIVDIVQMIDVVAGATGEFVVFGVPISFMAIEQQLLADMNMDEDINVMDVIDLILISKKYWRPHVQPFFFFKKKERELVAICRSA